MSCHSGPDVTTDGLVFYYDMSNFQNSWKGMPINNLYTNPLVCYGNSNFTNISSTSVAPDGSFTAQSWTPTIVGNMAQFWFYYALSTQVFTYSVWLKASYPSTFWLYPQGATESEKTSITVTTEWQRFFVTRTLSTEVTVGGLIRTNGGFNGTLYTWGHQLEQNSFMTPFVNGTRSSSQSILDMTKNNTITVNNLSYNSDGSFTFDGTDDKLSVTCAPNTIRLYNSTTEFIIKLPTYAGGQRCIMSYRGGGGGSLYIGKQSAGIFSYYNELSTAGYTTSASLANNAIVHVCVVCDSTNNLLLHYINGILVGSVARTGWVTGYCSSFVLGFDPGGTNEYMIGDMYSFKHYNRVLSSAEILQNFNAVKSRYGI